MTPLDFFRDYFTPVSVCVGGAWYALTWFREQKRQERREMPALDAKLEVLPLSLAEDRVLVHLTMVYQNPGPFIVFFNSTTNQVCVYVLGQHMAFGPTYHKADLGEPLYVGRPYSSDSFAAEPNTESKTSMSFVVPHGKAYLFRWRTRRQDDLYSWTREKIVDLRNMHR